MKKEGLELSMNINISKLYSYFSAKPCVILIDKCVCNVSTLNLQNTYICKRTNIKCKSEIEDNNLYNLVDKGYLLEIYFLQFCFQIWEFAIQYCKEYQFTNHIYVDDSITGMLCPS